MGTPHSPLPAKLTVGILTAHSELMPAVRSSLERLYGPVDFLSAPLPFTQTGYYDRELGTPIQRQFLAFERLISQDALARTKRECNALERQSLAGDRRLVNIDPGYVTAAKLVLATTKDNCHRIYIGDGIYAEVTLRYHRGRYEPWPWTYPDYASAAYRSIFDTIRAIYLDQLHRYPQAEPQ